jgi:ABC-type Fe3+ transport system permease subunit
MKNTKVYKLFASIVAFFVVMPLKAFAADSPAPVTIPSSVPAGPSVQDLAKNAINALIFIAGIACVIVIIIGGFMYIVSAGNPDRTKTAKDAILYAIIGLIISLAAFAIVNFVIGGIGG